MSPWLKTRTMPASHPLIGSASCSLNSDAKRQKERLHPRNRGKERKRQTKDFRSKKKTWFYVQWPISIKISLFTQVFASALRCSHFTSYLGPTPVTSWLALLFVDQRRRSWNGRLWPEEKSTKKTFDSPRTIQIASSRHLNVASLSFPKKHQEKHSAKQLKPPIWSGATITNLFGSDHQSLRLTSSSGTSQLARTCAACDGPSPQGLWLQLQRKKSLAILHDSAIQ